ncbi:MAG: penicillin-binding protein 2 [Nitrospirae bacterium]|nr:penicillin-binding protein 2 [Candidatus Manganitrophaceae bacterium]
MAGRYFPQEENRELESKIYWFFVILVAGLVLLLLRAWHLQVSKGAYYLELSENNRLRVVKTSAPRGRIFDRHGALLVNNVPSFNLYLVLADIQDRTRVLHRLSKIVEMSPDEISTRIEERKKGDPYAPIKIKEDLSMREVARIEGHGLELPGVKIEAEFKRDAVSGPLAAHLLGYVGEITQDQLKKETYAEVRSGTIIGQYGVEQSYDSLLRGTPGEKKIEVDALGHEQQVVQEILPVQGDDIFLSLDLKVQRAAEIALGNRPGVIVALDPANGDVLAMVSHPAFDPNLMSGGVSSEAWQGLIKDKDRPLTNRAIHGLYPPGSIFKIVVAAAILETELATAEDEIKCRGFVRFGKREFRDWKKWGHGEVDMHRSLVESCDVYYYEFGREVGVDNIAKFSAIFHLGKPTGIDLAYEKGGLIPTRAWKRKHFNEPWYPGETLSVAIGQGFVTTTPLQLAALIAAVAGDGVWHTPRLLTKSQDHSTDEITLAPASVGDKIPVSKKTLETIRKALAGVVSEKHGTGKKARSDFFSVAGKTGTAQVVGRETHAFDEVPEDLADHAWFVAFAPLDAPKIAVVVLAENGGHGGATAAPLALRVIEAALAPSDDALDASENVEKKPVSQEELENDHG